MAEHSAWEVVNEEPGERVRRMQVPGGWLYQAELRTFQTTISTVNPGYISYDGWHPPVFVPFVPYK